MHIYASEITIFIYDEKTINLLKEHEIISAETTDMFRFYSDDELSNLLQVITDIEETADLTDSLKELKAFLENYTLADTV